MVVLKADLVALQDDDHHISKNDKRSNSQQTVKRERERLKQQIDQLKGKANKALKQMDK